MDEPIADWLYASQKDYRNSTESRARRRRSRRQNWLAQDGLELSADVKTVKGSRQQEDKRRSRNVNSDVKVKHKLQDVAYQQQVEGRRQKVKKMMTIEEHDYQHMN